MHTLTVTFEYKSGLMSELEGLDAKILSFEMSPEQSELSTAMADAQLEALKTQIAKLRLGRRLAELNPIQDAAE